MAGKALADLAVKVALIGLTASLAAGIAAGALGR